MASGNTILMTADQANLSDDETHPLRDEVLAAASAEADLTIDMAALNTSALVTSSIIGLLIIAKKQVRALRIINVPDPVCEQLQIMRLNTVFSVTDRGGVQVDEA
jgi:anti-anti-sigma regulatory factor